MKTGDLVIVIKKSHVDWVGRIGVITSTCTGVEPLHTVQLKNGNEAVFDEGEINPISKIDKEYLDAKI